MPNKKLMRGVATEGHPYKNFRKIKRLRRSLVGVALLGHPIVRFVCKVSS